MIYFIGAGPGAIDLITVKGKELLEKADLIIYAGSLVNPGLLAYAKPECVIMDSASMTLEEVIAALVPAAQENYHSCAMCCVICNFLSVGYRSSAFHTSDDYGLTYIGQSIFCIKSCSSCTEGAYARNNFKI